ncbi:MAG: DUF1499 domain-containing protein [Oligoflexia bacterium]|nr:DUF1499 domain-containing protein [Oligoflexia bacterium]
MKSLFLSLTLASFLVGCSSEAPKDLGISKTTQTFKDCPDKKNCVSSFAPEDSHHYLAPLSSALPVDEAKAKIKKIVSDMPRVKLIEETDQYLRYEFTSAIFRFVDDVEFSFAIPDKIHFRSASRIGYSDLGANRKRLVHVKFQFNQNQY